MVARSAPPPGAGLQYQLLFGFLLADLNTAGDMRISGVPFPIFSFTVYTYISCSPLRFSFRSDAVSLSLRGEPPLPSDLEDNAALASLRFRKRALQSLPALRVQIRQVTINELLSRNAK